MADFGKIWLISGHFWGKNGDFPLGFCRVLWVLFGF
jgi:hypothetical protein